MPRRKEDELLIKLLRNRLKAAETQTRTAHETVAVQQQEIIELRVEMGKIKKTAAEELAAANKGWESMYDNKSKQAETGRKEASAARQRLDSLLAYTKLALKACQRGRRQKRKAKALGQARTMLEAGLEEDGVLYWAMMPEVQKAVTYAGLSVVGMAAALFGSGWFGKGKAKTE